MSYTLWFTGIPLSGKTTLARDLAHFLGDKGYKVEVLDSDDIIGLFGNLLGRESHDRELLCRSMAISAKILNNQGVVALCSATIPRDILRLSNRRLIGNYIEVFCRCPVHTAEERDYKRVYSLARKNMIKNFTGVHTLYEQPTKAEITLDTDTMSPGQCLNLLIQYLSREYPFFQQF